MVYGLKYFARYKSDDGKVKELRFSKADYSGPITEWFVTHANVEKSQGSSDSLFKETIVTSQKRLGLFFKERYDLTEFVYDRKTFFLEVVIIDTNKIEWSGWVEPWDAAHAYSKPPHLVSLTASCGLAHLSKKKYVNSDSSFKKTGLVIIQECLAIMGSDLPLRVSTHMMENSFTGPAFNGLSSFEVNVARYYNDNGEALFCDVIINDILNHYNAELTQWDNRWVIRGIVDHATGDEVSYIEYAKDGSSLPTTTPWPQTFIVNDTDAFTVDGAQERVLAPITKYRTEVDLGTQNPFFENGNMFLWSSSGLVGWDFTHMPNGNPGWERYYLGGEGVTASILKINGKSPEPYRKKKKKPWFKIIVLIATGANPLGAQILAARNKYTELEPAQWVESSAGKIVKGDKNLTVSFDYETAPNSSDVLISIRLHSSWKSDAPDRWLNFGVGDTETQEEFHLIRVPPVDREGLIYVGNLDVSGNPNYPNGTTPNWTYIVTGVPAGQVRKVGGANGVIVENGDLVISRIANTGGSQAATGKNWNVINVRNNTKKGTYEVTIPVDRNNLVSSRFINDPAIYDTVLVRFYKIAIGDNKSGDWYKVYNLRGTVEGFVPTAESSRYATTLERGAPTEEEAETINLITGDYNPWFTGSLTKPGSNENTKSWKRRTALSESLSIYRAMMLDRLCLTSRPLRVIEGEILITGNTPEISYLHTLVLADKGNMRLKITRFSYNDITRVAKITAVEVRYEEIPSEELRQDSYIPGQGTLNLIPGQGDGYYPSKSDSTNGRISAEDVALTNEELEEIALNNGRQGAMFVDIDPLTYVVAEESTEVINLLDFINQLFTEQNEDQEEEDMFDPETLILSVVDKPTWVSEVLFDKLEVTATALAPKVGDYYLTLTAYDEESETKIEFRVPILVEENEEFIEAWPPVFDPPLPTLFFEVGKQTTDGFVIMDYMPEDLVYEHLTYRIMGKPEWVSDQSVVFGEVSVTGKPVKIETRYLTLEMTDAIGRIHVEEITLACIKKTVLKHNLLDRGVDGPGVLGVIPGSFENPGKIDIESVVTGFHDKVERSLVGGGPSGDAVNETKVISVTETNLGTYLMFPDTDGIDTEVGQYKYILRSLRGTRLVTEDVIPFTLYDDEYLSKLSAELWDSTKDEVIGVIDPSGKSAFKKPVSFDPKIIVSELPHTKITLTYSKDGVQVLVKEIPVTPAAEEGEYNLFDEIVPAESGKYDLLIDIENAGVPVYQRLATWTIIPAEVLPGPGIQLVTARDNSINFDVLEDLPLNNTEVDIPDNYNFNILLPVDEGGALIDFDEKQDLFFDTTSGSAVEVDLFLYTNLPQVVKYAEGEDKAETLLFGNLTSLDLGKLHRAPSKVRVKVIYRKAGVVVAIQQADVSFRVPLGPEDYSGLRFISIKQSGGIGITVIDANMPKQGRSYVLPLPEFWSASARSFNGELFNAVKIELSKDGIWLRTVANPDCVTYFEHTEIVTELPSDDMAYVVGTNIDGIRFLRSIADGTLIPIDDLGEFVVKATFYLNSVEIGVVQSEFTLTDEEPEDLEYEPVDFQAIFDELFGLKTTDDLPEGEENLYFEEIRVLDTILVGLPTGVNSPIVEGTSVLQAFADLQKQIDMLVTGGGGRYVSLNPILGYASDTMASFNLASVINSSQFYVTNLIDGPFANNGFVSTVSRNGSSHFQTVGSETVEDSFWWRRKSGGSTGAWYRGASQSWTNVNYMSYVNFPSYFSSFFITAFNLKRPDIEAWVRATPLTGYAIGTNAALSPTDTVLSAFGKLEAKINATGYSGTLNYYAKYTSAGLGIGLMYDSGTRVGIGTSSPGGRLHVSGAESGTGTAASLLLSNTSAIGSNVWYVNANGPGYSGFLDGGFSLSDNTNFRFTITRTGLVGIGLGSVAASELLHVGGNIRTSLSFISDRTSGAPMVVNSTSLVSNFNSDYLDSQHGAYYLDRVNHTGMQAISTITGLQAALDAKSPALTGTGLVKSTGGVISYITDNSANWNTAFGWGNHAGLYYSKAYIDALDMVPGFRIISAGTGLLGGGNLYADRSFSVLYGTSSGTSAQGNDSRILNGQTAFTWGNHALAGYALSAAISGTAGQIMKFGTSTTAVNSIMAETSGRITTSGTHAAVNFESNAAPNAVTAYGYAWKNGTTARWELSKLGAESSGNAGSDMYFSRFADNGAFLGNIFSITRSSGLLTFSQVVAGVNPTASNHLLTLGYADGRYAPISHTHTFASLTSKPTDLAGYGITDAYNKTYIDAIDRVPGNRIISAGTGLSGGGNLYADRSFAVIYGTSAGTSAQGNDSRINNGQTAYTWGDHNGLYYNKAYIDAIDRVPGSRIIAAGTGLYGGGNLYADRTLYVLFGSGSGEVAQGNDYRINNGQTAYSWGNHAGQYLSNGAQITFNGNTYNLNSNPNIGSSGGGSNWSVSGSDIYRASGNVSIGRTSSIGSAQLSVQGEIYTYSRVYASGFTCAPGNITYLYNTLIGGGGLDPSAALQITSTTQGFLLPRMTRAQKLAIVSPADGLMVWQTDSPSGSTGGAYVASGGNWLRIDNATTPS
ncbi:hypothetical protein L0657_06790 [Dyadobacter sp. CY345]|uniref:hypothetical protein n=1 Tax=Dyadobacter sp. CY345 TaxID=2909335 RepID=UPI001F2E0726|nr:hypothetical protein [Dyadobacter sp. CY345]MCF2443657.1 hypothetical protein [Dyadobacter sp. CY345]